jgi:iron uptake system component EfeO
MKTQLRGARPASRRQWLAAPTLFAASALVLTACGSSPSGGGAPAAPAPDAPSGPTAVTLTLANASGADSCTPDKNSVPAGPVTFTVKNESAAGIRRWSC